MKQALLATAAIAAVSLSACQTGITQNQPVISPELADQPAAQALIAEDSANDFAATVSKLRAALEKRPLTIFAMVEHSKGAADSGLELAPSTLFIFGNPKAGTPLMQANPALGMELPMKILVIETSSGVQVLRQDIGALLNQYGVAPDSVNAGKIEDTLSGIVAEATG
jgi:uncharacterized protein (DUF302 family)